MRRILRTLALVIALLAALALSVSAAGICGHHAAHDAACGYQAAAAEVPCDLACTDTDADGIIDHAAECAYTPAREEVPCGYECQVCATQALIDALPDTVTGKNAAAVEAQITAIDTAKAALSAADAALLDMSKYEVAAAGLTVQKARPQGNDITVTTEAELLAAVAEANLRAAELAEGEEMAQMTIRLGNDISLSTTQACTWGSCFIKTNTNANIFFTSTAGNRFTLKPSDTLHNSSKAQKIYMIIPSGTLKVENLVLDCNTAPKLGAAAILTDHADVTLGPGTKITGYGKGPMNASAINVQFDSTFVMNGCEVTGNHATDQAIGVVFVSEGTFTLTDCWFHDNSIQCAPMYAMFGGCSMIGGLGGISSPTELIIRDSIFEDNANYNGYGGAISAYNTFVDGSISLEVSNCTFRHNKAGYGGAIAGRGSSEKVNVIMKIKDCTFTDNEAFGGGAIHASSCTNVTVENCTITGSKAYDFADRENYHGEGGGAIIIMAYSKGTVRDCTIKDSYAELSGGAIQVFAFSELTMENTVVSKSEAESHAGAICVADAFTSAKDTKSVLRLKNCTIEDSVSNSIWSDEDHQGDPRSPGGGGIYLHGNCELYIEGDTQIINNKVLGYGNGGGIYCCFGGYVEMNGGVIHGNSTLLNGGGIYVDGTGSYEGEIHNNNVSTDDSFGAGATMVLNDGRISGNTAKGNGGGIYISGKTSTEVNAAQQVFRGGLVRMNGGVITANRADDQGGGVYLQADETGDIGATFLMSDGALYRNIAGENGNGSTGAKDAGAELFAEGDIGAKTTFTVIPAKDITAYIRDTSHTYIPEADRTLVYTNWYDDYSDLDPTFGKGDPATWETGRNTGRYTTSKMLDRIVYTPEREDGDYEALILDTETQLTLKKTVSGENIQIESHVFTVTLGRGENNPMAGTRLPVTILGNVRSEDVVEEDGKLYIVFDATGTATFILDADDKLAIDRIPSGTEFRIVETDLGAAVGIDASVENAKDPAFDESSRVVTGSTEVKVDGETFVTQSDVIVDNHYTKPADDPADDPEDDPKNDPTDDPKDDPKDDPIDDPKDDPEADKPSGDSGNKKPDSDVPDTGDNMMLWLAFCLASLLALALPLKKLTK